jgi:hypothetical protein
VTVAIRGVGFSIVGIEQRNSYSATCMLLGKRVDVGTCRTVAEIDRLSADSRIIRQLDALKVRLYRHQYAVFGFPVGKQVDGDTAE